MKRPYLRRSSSELSLAVTGPRRGRGRRSVLEASAVEWRVGGNGSPRFLAATFLLYQFVPETSGRFQTRRRLRGDGLITERLPAPAALRGQSLIFSLSGRGTEERKL